MTGVLSGGVDFCMQSREGPSAMHACTYAQPDAHGLFTCLHDRTYTHFGNNFAPEPLRFTPLGPTYT